MLQPSEQRGREIAALAELEQAGTKAAHEIGCDAVDEVSGHRARARLVAIGDPRAKRGRERVPHEARIGLCLAELLDHEAQRLRQ